MEIQSYETKMFEFFEKELNRDPTPGDYILMSYFVKTLFQTPEELQFCNNDRELKLKVIKALNLNNNDVLLDIGTGYGDLLFMCKDSIKEGIGIDIWEKITEKADLLLNDYNNIKIYNSSFQEFNFPKNITKCVMLAWHCSPITESRIIEKLKKTNCKIFINNFGSINRLNIIKIGDSK